MRKRELTIHRRYEVSRLADTYLANAYEQLLRYSVKINNEKEVKKNDNNENNSIICRVSSRKQVQENTIESQIAELEHRIINDKHELLEGYKFINNSYSGSNLECPGLEKLFKDIKVGKIDSVIVYKIDRLSRSLLDFAKIVDIFEKYKVAFVSVTQSFNTANSIGRLMMNVVLSFAQYERELTGERIRDKIEASRKKGLWMGSRVPLGYDAKEKKLIINEKEAELVKHIFKSFVEMKSITNVTKRLNKEGYRTKGYKGKEGEEFKKATVRGILTNPTYIGFASHKGTLYKGQHEGIIDEELWNRVKENIRTRNYIESKREPVLLKGLMRCYACDASMQSTYAKKKNREYRYYVCGRHLKGRECKGKENTIAAGEIEQVIMEQIPVILKDGALMEEAFRKADKVIAEILKGITEMWKNIFPVEKQNIVRLLIKVVWFKEDGLKIEISKDGLKNLVEKYKATTEKIEVKGQDISVFIKYKLKKCSGKSMILVPVKGETREKKTTYS
ncbi:recombinase family protein [Wolbachia endosymbiont of Pentidionis agamae]|uniref:recombinase family protein n=1 Tax=Wolbachia endosymbiont of Pentidionis agamae TaxID=3110435 RepID=UPI002FD49BF4